MVAPLDGIDEARIAVPAPQEDRLVMRELVAAIDRLPAPQREALLLSTMSDMTHDQIAEIMNCRAGTVKSRISRARSQLHLELTGVALGDGDTKAPRIPTTGERPRIGDTRFTGEAPRLGIAPIEPTLPEPDTTRRLIS